MPQTTPRAPDRDADRARQGSKPTLFARNRRDGARLLSSALILTTIALVAWQHPLGQGLAVIGSALCLFWWLQYRQLKA